MKYVVASTCTAAIIAASTTTSHADPQLPGIHYTARAVADSAVLSTDAGSLDTADDQLEIRDDTGTLLATFPLSYYRDNEKWPIAARIDGRTATLTPSVDPAAASPAPGSTDPLHDAKLDLESDDFNKSLSQFSTIVGVGTALGTIIGTLVGAGIGCLAGGLLVGGAAAVPTIGVLAIPGFLGGCIVTAVPAAAIGALVGTIAFGGTAVVIGGILLGDELNRQNATP